MVLCMCTIVTTLLSKELRLRKISIFFSVHNRKIISTKTPKLATVLVSFGTTPKTPKKKSYGVIFNQLLMVNSTFRECLTHIRHKLIIIQLN